MSGESQRVSEPVSRVRGMGQRAKAELSGSRKVSAMMGFIFAVGRALVCRWEPRGVAGIYSKQGVLRIVVGWI